jgi:hypothetical protein
MKYNEENLEKIYYKIRSLQEAKKLSTDPQEVSEIDMELRDLRNKIAQLEI